LAVDSLEFGSLFSALPLRLCGQSFFASVFLPSSLRVLCVSVANLPLLDSVDLPLISYIFDRINNFKLDPGERTIIFNPTLNLRRRNHNIEHFLPKKPTDETAIDPATLSAIDNIGNLLPTSFRANSSLGNLPPAKKIQKLEGELGRKTNNLNLVKEFVKQYGHQSAEWNEKAIRSRAHDMAIDAYDRVWKLS
jgi:hypothetical protein